MIEPYYLSPQTLFYFRQKGKLLMSCTLPFVTAAKIKSLQKEEDKNASSKIKRERIASEAGRDLK